MDCLKSENLTKRKSKFLLKFIMLYKKYNFKALN